MKITSWGHGASWDMVKMDARGGESGFLQCMNMNNVLHEVAEARDCALAFTYSIQFGQIC